MGTQNEQIPLKQKLRLADAYIKQLKGEIGMLESEKEELEDKLWTANEEVALLKHEISSAKMSKGQKNSIRKAIFGQQAIKEYSTMRSKIKQLKADNRNLIEKLHVKQNKQ